MNLLPWFTHMKIGWFINRWIRLAPHVFVVEPTNRCNLRCHMCPSHGTHPEISRSRDIGDMPVEQFQTVIQQISHWVGKRSGYIIVHGAGEPLMHPRYIDLLRIIRNAGNLRCGFLTNGVLFDPEISREIVSLGVSDIGFSLNGLDDTTYQSITGTTAWNKATDHLHQFLELLEKCPKPIPFVRIQIVSSPETDHLLDAFLNTWLPRVNEIVIQIPRGPTGRTFEGNGGSGDTGRVDRFPCHRITVPMTIGWNGDVYLCCEDWHGEMVIGNVLRERLDEIQQKRRDLILTHRIVGSHAIPLCADCINRFEPHITRFTEHDREWIESPLWTRVRRIKGDVG